MPVNPLKQQEQLDSPLQRGNPLNDPKFKNEQGYNVYDLDNSQFITPRFGQYTPISGVETVPGDRHFFYSNSETVLNQIDAPLMSEVNEYHDHVFVPMRCVFPYNYEKMVPNPTKGDDLPYLALPQIPLLNFIRKMIFVGVESVRVSESSDPELMPDWYDALMDAQIYGNFGVNFNNLFDILRTRDVNAYLLENSLIYASQILSRGQLLDYLGYCPDIPNVNTPLVNQLQEYIDKFYQSLGNLYTSLQAYRIDPNEEGILIDYSNPLISYIPNQGAERFDLFRNALDDSLEAGAFIVLSVNTDGSDIDELREFYIESAGNLLQALYNFTNVAPADLLTLDEADPFSSGAFINPLRPAAYQLAISEYGTNDHVDNVFNASLYMQNLRAVMFPSSKTGFTREPVFDYNGVEYEYDLLTTGAWYHAFISEEIPNWYGRMLLTTSLLFFLRRSLRYGDYFSTGRPDLLAVGQLGIPVDSNGTINPIDVTKNLVLQRFLNAVNWVGSRFVNYMSTIFGVKPTLTEPHPVYVSHRKIPLLRQTTTNTADKQGKQTTNLLGTADKHAIDVFIDDFGFLIGFVSYDALPVYTSGIDRNFTNSDRFSMFNSMLQNVGDQEIAVSELLGWPGFIRTPFAYTARYAQYKFGLTKAHGAFVNELKSFVMKYPPLAMFLDTNLQYESLKISPMFIRDKPYYFDQMFAQRSGLSPAEYYHFWTAVTNVHSAARKMMYQPPVL